MFFMPYYMYEGHPKCSVNWFCTFYRSKLSSSLFNQRRHGILTVNYLTAHEPQRSGHMWLNFFHLPDTLETDKGHTVDLKHQLCFCHKGTHPENPLKVVLSQISAVTADLMEQQGEAPSYERWSFALTSQSFHTAQGQHSDRSPLICLHP